MATFYYNQNSDESIHSQWIKHLQTSAYVDDIGRIVTKNKGELQKVIQNASAEQIKAVQQVCGKIEEGFSEVNQHLQDIKFNISGLRGEINEMASMLDWRLSEMVEEQRITNLLLLKISKLLRLPDSQKEKIYYIEEGLKYLKNAIIDGIESDFYDKAYKCFKEAEKKGENDFITLNKIGFIHLHSKKYSSFSDAKDYFLKSALESFAEARAGGTTISNSVDHEIIENYGGNLLHAVKFYKEKFNCDLQTAKEQVDRIFQERGSNINNNFIVYTAESYLYVGRICYLQQNLTGAIEYATKAYKLLPEFLEASFERAKYLAANNQEDFAVDVLTSVIKRDRYFSIKTLGDQDLASKSYILKLLENLQKDTIKKAKKGLAECKSKLKPESQAENIVAEIETLISKGTFLSAMKALDLLNSEYQLPLQKYVRGYYDSTKIVKQTTKPSLKIVEFINEENKNAIDYKNLYETIKQEIVTSYVQGFAWGGAGLGFVIGFFKGCTIREFSMEWNIWFITIIIFAAIGAGIGIIIGQGQEPKTENS